MFKTVFPIVKINPCSTSYFFADIFMKTKNKQTNKKNNNNNNNNNKNNNKNKQKKNDCLIYLGTAAWLLGSPIIQFKLYQPIQPTI